ncbi:MAG: hypothetical protein OEM97_07460 [Acidimicrobiia bacterium]|nr:hypothetical protein [Acidimicrobiia bacterium]
MELGDPTVEREDLLERHEWVFRLQVRDGYLVERQIVIEELRLGRRQFDCVHGQRRGSDRRIAALAAVDATAVVAAVVVGAIDVVVTATVAGVVAVSTGATDVGP